jgi:hypothetical protein
LARERTASQVRIAAVEDLESGAASRAIGCTVVMGGRHLAGHDESFFGFAGDVGRSIVLPSNPLAPLHLGDFNLFEHRRRVGAESRAGVLGLHYGQKFEGR